MKKGTRLDRESFKSKISFSLDKDLIADIKHKLKKSERSKFVNHLVRSVLSNDRDSILFRIKEHSMALEYWKYQLSVHDEGRKIRLEKIRSIAEVI